MADDKEKALAATGAFAAASGAAVYLGTEDERRIKNKKKKRKDRQTATSQARTAKTNAAQAELSQEKIRQLERIQSKDLSAEDKKVKTELIKREKDIIKGVKPASLAKIAAKIGLKSIPAVGAFLSMFSCTPAYAHGGKVSRGRSAQGSAEKNG